MPRVLLTLALLATLACSRGPASSQNRGRGVLVIAIDALRYDHTSLGGYDRKTTPRLADFAEREGVHFSQAWTTGPGLLPAHVSLLTGCDPMVARPPKVVLSDGEVQPPIRAWFVPPTVPRLAEEFLAEGWSTAAFVDHRFLNEERGFNSGFQTFEGLRDLRENTPRAGLGRSCKALYRWVTDLDEGEDWMAYLHFNDLELLWDESEWLGTGHPEIVPAFRPRPALDHVPPVAMRSPSYHAVSPTRLLEGRPTLAEYEVRYDSALVWVDQQLDRLLYFLKDSGHLQDTTVVVVGTYGIGFGESGFLVDAGSLSDVDLHVPLVIRPAISLGLETGRTVDALVSLMDLAPTLLSLYQIPAPQDRVMHGRDMTPLLRGATDTIRPRAYASHGHAEGFCVVDSRWTYSVTRPGAAGSRSALSRTWYGDERLHRTEEVRVLKDRRADHKPGILGLGVGHHAVAADLHAFGEAWYRDLELARDVLHPSPWNADKRTSAVKAELRAKHLIGEF
ncbi:MAG: sulfatase [Planctomycetota bacterium]